jgi:hypothetical protein
VAGYEVRNLQAQGRIDGRTIRVDGVADAYNGRASAAGTVQFGQPLTLDLAGRASNVDLRNLPAQLNMPGVPSDLQFAYTLTGRGGVFTAGVTLEPSTLAGATIAGGSTGQITIGNGAPAYAAKGRVADLDLQQIGRGFNIGALATDKYASQINATFDMNGSGGGRYPLTVNATGTLVDSRLFGASFPTMDLDAHLAGGNAQVAAVGQFSGLDPAAVTGNEKVKGALNGSADVTTTIRDYAGGLTVDSIDVAGRIDLGDSTIAGLDVNSAVFDGRYAGRQGELTQFSIAGPDLNANGAGTIALNDTGSSNLTAHLASPSLGRLGEIIGQPIKGAAEVDVTVTGNASELHASGTLQGSNIGYGENEALSLKSQFSAAMPGLTPERATVEAKSEATFLEVGGQRINELTADTTYSQASGLTFNAQATQGMRQLAAAGNAIFHPDHREVRLESLSLRTEQIVWQTDPAAGGATVRYGADRLGIENLQLVSGDQRIEAEGTLGAAAEGLNVHAENVDVAQLDQLALDNRQLAGRLSADATLRGPVDDLRAEGTFTLNQGAFQRFTFDSLTGMVDYVGRGIDVDVRMQQSPQAWLTANGYVPLSLFRRNPAGVTGHETPAAPGEAIDLRIATSQIDLGIVQGFTSYVSNVTGQLQADVRLTGTGTDPHAEGYIDIRGGAFEIPDAGTAYTGLDTRIAITPDLVTIDEMKIVDEHQKVMTVGGSLAVHERSVGAVDIQVRSEDFEVIDNQDADLKLDTDIHVTGELRKPRLQGFVEVESGTVDVARIMERVTSDPYATTAVPFDEMVTPGSATPEAASTEADVSTALSGANLFDALDLELGIAVPSNLVLRGTDIRPANATIDIGDMVVTVGGAVQLRKLPGGELRLLGEVNTVRGNYTFQGRRFEIMRDGRIRFGGGEEIDPIVDLQARRVISGVETFVRVQGTLHTPELTFRSNPPLDQADILSLIVFNMPINELGEGQQATLAERAGALAGGYLASGLSRSIANALELDEFEIQAQGESGSGPSIALGEQVGERLFFRIRQGFGSEQATEFILEYQIADFLRLQGSVAETSGGTQRVSFRRVERAGLDLIFFFSY